MAAPTTTTTNKRYIGTKMIDARPMKLGAYNLHRGWTIPQNEDPHREGYLVIYADGYESWSPKEVFEEAYRLCDAMTFGLAIEAMKKGKKVARAGWNGKDMFVYLVSGFNIPREKLAAEAKTHLGACILAGASVDICSRIDMKAADGSIVVGWVASQTDMLAEDWFIVE